MHLLSAASLRTAKRELFFFRYSPHLQPKRTVLRFMKTFSRRRRGSERAEKESKRIDSRKREGKKGKLFRKSERATLAKSFSSFYIAPKLKYFASLFSVRTSSVCDALLLHFHYIITTAPLCTAFSVSRLSPAGGVVALAAQCLQALTASTAPSKSGHHYVAFIPKRF